MTHPSVYELARFVESGHESADFEAHLQTCEACAARLTRLAQRALEARGLAEVAVVPSAPMPTVMPVLVALFACLCVLVSTPSRAAAVAPTVALVSSGELHGTPDPRAVADAPMSMWQGDAGPGSRSD